MVELAVPSRIESMPGLVTRRRLDGGGGVVGREVAWSREAGDVTDRAKIIAAVASRGVVYERHRVGLVGFFLAGCCLECRGHLLELVGFDQSYAGLCQAVEAHIASSDGPFVVLFGQ